MHLDDSACNLASLNLLKFLKDDGSFDTAAFKHAVEISITAQDIIVDNSSYPTEEITANAKAFRELGLGYANLGALLMSLGLPYDSEAGRQYAGAITALMTGQAYLQSARLAEEIGPFSGYAKNSKPMLKVIDKHRSYAYKLDPALVPLDLLSDARRAWDEALLLGQAAGYRNSQASVLAPTGTIAFMMDCDTTGVEPDIALVKYKRLVGGGMLKIVNNTVPRYLKRLGYDSKEIQSIVEYIDEHETIEGMPEVPTGYVERAVALKGDAGLLRLGLARAQIETGDAALLASAIENLEAATRLEPKVSQHWYQLGIARGRAGERATSSLAFAEAAYLRGNAERAYYYATLAAEGLPHGSTGWLRAEDILNAAKLAARKRR